MRAHVRVPTLFCLSTFLSRILRRMSSASPTGLLLSRLVFQYERALPRDEE
jgi:hypothetical protein